MTRPLQRVLGVTLILASAVIMTGLPRPHPQPNQTFRKNSRLEAMLEESRRYVASGLFQQVVKVCERGVALSRAEGDRNYTLKFLNNLGGAHLAMFDFQAAIDAFLQAKEIAEKQRNEPAIVATAANLAALYLQVYNVTAAEQVAAQGLKAAGASDPYGDRSRLLQTLARLRWFEDRKPEAIAYINEAIEAGRAKSHQNAVASAWDCLGNMRLDSGDLEGAEGPLAEGFRLRLLFHDPNLDVSYINLSRLRLEQGDPNSAANLLARGTSSDRGLPGIPLWSLEWLRGKILQAQNHPAEALEQFEKAVSAWRSSGETLAPADAHRSTLASYRKINALFTSLIEASLARNPAPNTRAFVAAEEYRAVALRLTLTKSAGRLQRLDPEYWQILNQLRNAQTEKLSGNVANFGLARLREVLTEHEVKAGLSLNRTRSNKTNEKYEPAQTLRDIRGTLGPGEALLSVFLGNPVSGLWAVSNKGIEFHRLRSQKVLSEAAGKFRRSVEHDSPDRDAKGEQLYNWLFRELSPEIQQKPFWLIASADEIFDIPMAALVVTRSGGRSVYLVEKHATERIPSALMLHKQPAEPTHGRFLGVADGIYNVADPRWKRVSSTANFLGIEIPAPKVRPAFELARLAGSAQEINACARIWQGSQPPVLLTGWQASRANFQSDLLNRPSVIHLAAHVLSGTEAKDALIDFGLSARGQPEVLTYSDIANLDVERATVIVNGCASSSGQTNFGAGAMGLTRAWLLAGAQTVVGTRWPIPDDTGNLFESFYASWSANRGTTPAKRIVAHSLQQAQLAVLRENTWRSSPKYWSAFYVFGKE